jgi:proteic killer suppression protein
MLFGTEGTPDVFHGRDTSAARSVCPQLLWARARRKLDLLDSVTHLADLAVPPGNRLEPLRGGRAGQHSIRINHQYRICFVWAEQGPRDVEITDYHR